jgi:hypothetical protein
MSKYIVSLIVIVILQKYLNDRNIVLKQPYMNES